MILLQVHQWCVFFSLRRGGGGGLQSSRKGHGTAGGSGVWCGPDHPLCHHLLLTRPGYFVKKTLNKLKNRCRHERVNRANQRLIEAHRGQFVEGEEAEILRTSVLLLPQLHWRSSVQASCLHVEGQHQMKTAPSLASGLESHVWGVFPNYISFLCQQPSLGRPMPLWLLTLEGFLLHSWQEELFLKRGTTATTCNNDEQKLSDEGCSECDTSTVFIRNNTVFISIKYQPYLQVFAVS